MADVRDEVQRKAKEAFLDSNRKNSIIASVGSGKSKIALDIIKELNPSSILLLTNAVNLRDINWKNEFEKFNMHLFWDRVESQTYQAMYDKEWDEYDLVVLDEIDFACSPRYSECFIQANKHSSQVVGLTGFITDDKRVFLEEHFPICYEITTETMQDDNMLNQSEFIFVEFPLSKERTIEQKLKKGGVFKTSENDNYKYWDKKFQQAMIVKSTLYKKYRLQSIEPETQQDYLSADWSFKFMATKRKAILTSLESSIKVTMNILRVILSNPDNKVIVFSTTQKQCDKLPNPYHAKANLVTLDHLNDGRVKVLSVVKKITRGVNLVGVNYLIRETYDGSEEIFNQSHGRLLRLRPDQIARYIILVPYYEDFVKHVDGTFKKTLLKTQASTWVDKMTRSFNLKNVRYIKLDSVYEIKDGIDI